MDNPTVPVAICVKTNNIDVADSEKMNTTHNQEKKDTVGYPYTKKQFASIYQENVLEVSDSTCLSSHSNTIQNDANSNEGSSGAVMINEAQTLENSGAGGSNEKSMDSVMCKNKRSRKQFRIARVYSDNNKEENITSNDLNEIKVKNICKKSAKNNNLSDSVETNTKNSNISELICESNKTNEHLENLNTLINSDAELLRNNKITSAEVTVNKFTSNQILTQQRSESDEFETIDKIADMIASTGYIKSDILTHKLNEHNHTALYNNNKINNIAKKLTNVKKGGEAAIKPSFEEVETRLEEMFAGIEDETFSDIVPPVSYLSNSENVRTEDRISNSNIAFNVVPSVDVYQNEIIAQKRIHSPKNYPSKKKRKVVKKSFGLKANKHIENKLKPKNIKEESILTDKYKGPYIQLNSEGVINVVNAPLSEEDSEKRNKIKKLILNYTKTERNKIIGLHVSTLSTKYDADTTDISWLCFFCKKGPHKTEQGDLFGPYIVNTNCEEFRLSQNYLQNVLEIQRVRKEMYQKDIHRFPIVPSILSSANKFRTEHKQPRKFLKEESPPKRSAEIFSGMVKISDTSYEVWVHEDCIIWASGIYLIGSKIIGLESAVWRSTTNVCSVCSTNGAIVCCLQRECKEMSHLACAKSENWTVSENDFKTYCKAHSERVRH